MNSTSDRIVKTTRLRAPLARVWRAIADARQFGAWFGVELDGSFEPGARLTARIIPTQVDAAVAKLQEPHRGKTFLVLVERVDPMRILSFRWHPHAVADQDYAHEPTTLVEFELEPAGDETTLTVSESGFDAIPLARRAEAFSSNERGWELQLGSITTYLARPG